MGRPKADKPKSVNYTIRLDIETEIKLREYCEENSITRGEAVRVALNLLLSQKRKKK